MRIEEIKGYIAQFLCLLASMLIAMSIYYGVESMIVQRPVLISRGGPFKVYTPVVKPGGVVEYHIDYFKRLDIPGDLIKQLIVVNKDTGKESYIPLQSYPGHLPTGVVQKIAYARIPEWSPEGRARIKLSSIYRVSREIQFSSVYTDWFEVRQ